jgi:hypothetical protein
MGLQAAILDEFFEADHGKTTTVSFAIYLYTFSLSMKIMFVFYVPANV